MAGSIPGATQVELPLTLRPRRLPIIVRAVAFAALVPVSLLLMPMWKGVFCAVVATVFAQVFAVMLVPGLFQVVVTEKGIEIPRLRGGPLVVAWRDIASFHVRRYVGLILPVSVSVGWHYSLHADAPSFGDFPPLYYSRRELDALAALLNALRQRYG